MSALLGHIATCRALAEAMEDQAQHAHECGEETPRDVLHRLALAYSAAADVLEGQMLAPLLPKKSDLVPFGAVD